VVLHCNGKLVEIRAVAAESPLLAGEAERRAETALAARQAPDEIDTGAMREKFAALMAEAAVTS
jgi:beta-N-acetylhexosaminidase